MYYIFLLLIYPKGIMTVGSDNEEDKERDKDEEEEVAADNDDGDGQEIKLIYSTNHILMIQNCMYYLIDITALSLFALRFFLFKGEKKERKDSNVDRIVHSVLFHLILKQQIYFLKI